MKRLQSILVFVIFLAMVFVLVLGMRTISHAAPIDDVTLG